MTAGTAAAALPRGSPVSASKSPIGSYGRVTASGGIRPGRLGEVMVSIRGGVEAFLARDADGGSIDPYEEIAVVDYQPPRTVIVTRVYEKREGDASERMESTE
jgi:hypothetical protein